MHPDPKKLKELGLTEEEYWAIEARCYIFLFIVVILTLLLVIFG